MADAWPLVGRDEELDRVVDALSRGTGVVVEGDAGVGKTRLVGEALARIREAGVSTEWVRATEAGRSIPLAPFGPLIGARDDHAEPDALLRGATTMLAERAEAGGLVVAVDDAHLLDETSLALLHVLATQTAVLVLLSVRAGEPAPDGLLGLWKDEILERIDLEPLTREQTERLVLSVLGDGVATTLVERIWRLSRGNALFIRELVMAAVERRRSGSPGALLVLSDRSRPDRRLRELVEERLRLLDDGERGALEVLAVGELVPLAVAEALLGAEHVSSLEERSLVHLTQASGVPTLEVAHPLYGEVLRVAMPVLRRRAILRELTDAGEHGTTDHLRLAAWRVESGEPGSPAELVEGAEEALARLDLDLAEELARVAGDDARASIVLAETLAARGHFDDADQVLSKITDRTPLVRARVTTLRASTMFWTSERSDEALALLEDTEQALDGHPAAQSECRAVRAMLQPYRADREQGLALAESVLQDPAAPDSAQARAAAAAVVLHAGAGRSGVALDLAQAFVPVADAARRDAPFARLQARSTYVVALMWAGRYLDAESYVAADLGLDVRQPPPAVRGILEALRGGVDLFRGRARRAQGRLGSAIRAYLENDWFAHRPWACAFQARAAVYCGDLDAARAAIDASDAGYAADPVRSAFTLPDLELSRAWLMAAEGRRGEAIERLLALGAVMEHLALPIGAEAFHDAARLGAAEQVVDALAGLVERSDSVQIPVYLEHAQALAAADAPRLDAVARRFAELGADLHAAEAFRAASNGFWRQGKSTAAFRSFRACEEALRRCGPIASPALEPEASLGEELTPREREVASLAAGGLTSQDIADRLDLSVRTVDTHLGRVYRKLAIDGRSELGAALGVEP